MLKNYSSFLFKIFFILVFAIILFFIIFKSSSKQNDEWKDKILIVTSDIYDKTVLSHHNKQIDSLEKNNYIKILRYKYTVENFNYENFISDILALSNKYEPTLIVFCPISSVYLSKNNQKRADFINTISRPRLVGITSINQDGFFDCIYSQDQNTLQDVWKSLAESLNNTKYAFIYNSSINNSRNIERVLRETNNPNLMIFNEYPFSVGESETETIFNAIKDYDIVVTPYILNISNLLKNYKNELNNKKWIVGTNLYSLIDKKNILGVICPDVYSLLKEEIDITKLNIQNITDKKEIKYTINSFDKNYTFSNDDNTIDENNEIEIIDENIIEISNN